MNDLSDRVKTLEAISGLRVVVRKACNGWSSENVFEFFQQNRMVKTCFTYPKARVFAEGVKLGKSLKEHYRCFACGYPDD